MKSKILPVKVHTIGQLLAPLGITNKHQGIHVISTKGNEEELSLLYPFRSDHFSFLIVNEGEIALKVNLLEYTIGRNNALLLPPNVVRQFVKVSGDIRVVFIAFTADFLSSTSLHMKNVDALEFLSSQMNLLLTMEDKELALLIKLLDFLELKLDIPDGQAFQEEVLLNVFTGFIYEIGSLYRKQEFIEEVKGSRKEELTFRFLKILPQHFKEERSVQAYASLLNVTPKHLSQTLKEVSGRTAGSFIDEIVVMEAKILLSDITLTIGEVASYLNFSDQFFFSKYFKKQSGMSPSQYRNAV
jgi:AraC family transcriptional activator of pobA